MVFFAVSSLWAQNRYALVIGNANYDDQNITTLPNAINDTNDITAALRNLGFDTVLRQNLTQREMAREFDTFMAKLRGNRNSEGFFWYAGHAMEINGENLLLPTDVDRSSESLVKISSYSATNLAKELERIPNKLNLMVLDACRTPPSIGSERGRGAGDVTRLVKTIQVDTADLLIIFSTASGAEALDGSGKNSPFTEAFLKHIYSTDSLVYTLAEIIDDTKSLTNLRQTPYYSGNLGRDNIRYSLNQSGVQPTPSVFAGFEYDIIDGRSVTITNYTGNAAVLDIPAQIQGLPVTAIGRYAFEYCESLTSITIPSSVTSIGYSAFSSCRGLSSVTIPSSVTSIDGNAFSFCNALTSITVDSRNSAYASIDGVLFDKGIRTIIAYPAGKTTRTYTIPSSVTFVGNASFSVANSLTSITIPSSVTSIDSFAFANCYVLSSIAIPSSVTSIGYSAFTYCNALTSITVDSRNSAYASIDGVLFDKSIRTIITYPAGKTTRTYSIPSSVASIGEGTFYNCSSLTNITIPSSVTSIGNSAFGSCSSLTSITIPSSVTSIGWSAFANCIGLSSITIPSSVTSIGGYAFSGCSGLTSITLSRRTQVEQNAFPSTTRITYRD